MGGPAAFSANTAQRPGWAWSRPFRRLRRVYCTPHYLNSTIMIVRRRRQTFSSFKRGFRLVGVLSRVQCAGSGQAGYDGGAAG